MIFQAGASIGTNPLGSLTAFVTAMLALSVASERVTETVK
jgi:hypothetical protein